MSIAIDYPSYSDARGNFKELLDAAAAGRTVTVARDGQLAAVLPVERLREHLVAVLPARVRVFAEDGRVIALMEDHPFVAEGASVDDAVADLIEALREYAQDWDDRLKSAPNHHDAWAFVQLVKLSTDEQLRTWFEDGQD